MCSELAEASSTLEEEFTSLEKFQNEDFHIITCFEKCDFKPGQLFRARITHIYDISKFWMVIKYQELEIFQKYLFRWYYVNRRKYRIPVDRIKKDMYCVVFCDGGYYRGLIVGFPCDLQTEPEVRIYFIDYGMLRTIETVNLYYMNAKCFEVPQFVVRASLADVCPRDTHQWTNESVLEFHELVDNKCLIGVILHIDVQRQVLYVHISGENENGISTIPFHKTLVADKHARYFYEKVELVEDNMNIEPRLKYPYLFPSHAVVESGKVPSTLSDMEYQLQFFSVTSVVARYYKSKNRSDAKTNIS